MKSIVSMFALAGFLIVSQTLASSPNSLNSSGKRALCDVLPVAAKGLTDQNVTKLKIVNQKVGTGAVVVAGKTITMNYYGRLVNGTKFDTSCGRSPFIFTFGVGEVIAGWDQGIVGMKVGGIRRLIIPSSLGYGAAGAGSLIPPNAALVFDVELLAIK